MRTRLLLLLVGGLLAVSPALADNEGAVELGIYGGYGWLDDYGQARPDDDSLFGGRVGFHFTDSWSLEGSWQMMGTETNFSPSLGLDDVDFDRSAGRLNILFTMRSGKTIRPFITGGIGIERAELDPGPSDSDTGFNAGGGVRWQLTDHLHLRLDGRYVIISANDTQKDAEAAIGLSWLIGGGPPADSDGDGVPDRKDDCPDTPRGATVDEKGCPKDSDGDGVFDGIDRCPDTPKGWPVDASGCPIDSDGDGVPDGKDKCPNTPKGATVDENGCPKDSDGDGVYDGIDRCPNTPKGAVVDANGCPKDSDGDGVPDGLDKCPDTPRGAKVDANGCPIETKAPDLFKDRGTLVLEGVNFETDKWDILPASAAILDRVAASLRDWPEVKVEVEGHTDSTGGHDHNMQLSDKRAHSVMDYLASKGVDASRMTANGYGETKPVADNKTKDGRAKNRRVELVKQ